MQKITVKYILDHPDEFSQDDEVLVLKQKDVPHSDPLPRKQRKVQDYPLTQFELLGKWNRIGINDTIPVSEYEILKSVTGLTADDRNVSYQVDKIWFVTRSKKTLDKVNAQYGTDFQFNDIDKRTCVIPKDYEY